MGNQISRVNTGIIQPVDYYLQECPEYKRDGECVARCGRLQSAAPRVALLKHARYRCLSNTRLVKTVRARRNDMSAATPVVLKIFAKPPQARWDRYHRVQNGGCAVCANRTAAPATRLTVFVRVRVRKRARGQKSSASCSIALTYFPCWVR